MSQRQALIESLEGRSLLSTVPMLPFGMPMPPAADSAATTTTVSANHPAVTAKPKATAKPKTAAKPFSVLGEWDGRLTVKAFPFKAKYDLDLDFTSVTNTTAQGTITIDDHDYSGRWTGTTNKQKGYFSYTLKKHGDKITITGTLNAKSTYSWGTVKVDWGWRNYKGDFTLTKIS